MRIVAALAVVLLNAGCLTYSYAYTLRTAPGPVRSIPVDYFGAAPGAVAAETLTRNGWAMAESREGILLYVRGGGTDLGGVSEAESIVREQPEGGLKVEMVRLRYARTRLATYKALVQTLTDKHGAPQSSEVVESFAGFALDPKSDRPRPPRVVVHRWQGMRTDMVLVAGLENEENLASAMDYQVLLLPAASAGRKAR